jgi:hypothetical protein
VTPRDRGGPGDWTPGDGWDYDPQRKLVLPLASRGEASGPQEPGEHRAGPAGSRRKRMVAGLAARAVCGALACLILLLCDGVLPTPLPELLATVPLLFIEDLSGLLEGRKAAFPASIRDARRQWFLVAVAYAVLLVIVLDIEGALVRAAGGGVLLLGLLDLLTGAAMGALIGWRSPRRAAGIIVETAWLAGLLGAVADLGLLGSRDFHHVHDGAALVVVVAVNGMVLAVSGVLGYLALRAGRARPARGAALGGLVLLAVIVVAAYVLPPSPGRATGASRLAAGIYLVKRPVAVTPSLAVTLVYVQVIRSGRAAFVLTYRNTGRSPEYLSCTGFSDPGAVSVTLSDGSVMRARATYCSDHPRATQKVAPGQSVTSYAVFAASAGLARPFSFHWYLGHRPSGTILRVDLTGHAVFNLGRHSPQPG